MLKISIPNTDYDGSETARECRIFQLGSMTTNAARCMCEIISRIAMAKSAFDKLKNVYSTKLDLNLRKTLFKCYIWNIVLYGAETLTLWKVDQECLVSFKLWCWRRIEKISWSDHVRNEVSQRVREEGDIIQTIKIRKAN
jgi:hypothetical protein